MISSSKQHTKGSTNGNNAAWSRQSDWVLISLASNQAWRKFFKSSGDKRIYSGINVVLHLLIFGFFQGLCLFTNLSLFSLPFSFTFTSSYFFDGCMVFERIRLSFLPSFPMATFIPCPKSILESRVLCGGPD